MAKNFNSCADLACILGLCSILTCSILMFVLGILYISIYVVGDLPSRWIYLIIGLVMMIPSVIFLFFVVFIEFRRVPPDDPSGGRHDPLEKEALLDDEEELS